MSNPYTPRRYDGTKRNREYQSVNTKKEAGGSVHLCGNTTPLGTKIETDQLWNFRVVCVWWCWVRSPSGPPSRGENRPWKNEAQNKRLHSDGHLGGSLSLTHVKGYCIVILLLFVFFFPALICMMGSASVVNGSDV